MKTDPTRWIAATCLALIVAEAVLVLTSWILSVTMVEGVHSLLSSEGIRWFFGNFTHMMASPALVWLLLMLSALGTFQKSGLVAMRRESYRDRLALRFAILFLLAYVAAILMLTLMPHAVLLSATGSLVPSPFTRSLVPLIAFGIIIVAVAFGLFSGRLRNLSDILEALSFGIQKEASLVVLYIFFMQFYESLRFVFL
jgi:aminobenzoyl-glutamate transport protein